MFLLAIVDTRPSLEVRKAGNCLYYGLSCTQLKLGYYIVKGREEDWILRYNL